MGKRVYKFEFKRENIKDKILFSNDSPKVHFSFALKPSDKKNDFSTVLWVVLKLRGFHISSVSFTTQLTMFVV